jgi:type IV pilus assembly protein PilF
MLKFGIVALIAFSLLSACSSSTPEQRLIGSGSFNAQEASKTRVSLGLTYLQNGNFTQAKFNLDKALEFAPRSADAHYAMAYYYEQVEEIKLAEQSYQQAIDYSPKNADILNSYGAFLCKQSKYEDAKSFFLKAVNSKNYISTAETYENLAICSQSQGLKAEALDYFKSALNHQPTRPQLLFLLAKLQTELQQFAEAKKTLWKFERNSAVSAESLFLSYQIARGLGDTKGALGYGELLKSMFPNHQHTKTYAKEMGKFQPVAQVQRKEPRVVQPLPTKVTEPSVDKNKTSVTLAPPTAEVTVEEAAPENMTTTLEKTENDLKTEIDNTDYHIVKPKENLYRISLRYNVKMKRLMEWNDLDDPASIRIGMKLWVKDPN